MALTEQEALQYLVNGVELGQKRGAYSLEEATLLHAAVKVFTVKPEEVPQIEQETSNTEPEAASNSKTDSK